MPSTSGKRAVAAAITTALVCGAAPGTAAAGPDHTRASVARRASTPAEWTTLRCGGASRTPVRDDAPIVVALTPARFVAGSMPASLFTRPASQDPTWQLTFYSFAWLRPLAKRAYDDGQHAALERLIAQVDASYRYNPDRGRNTLGWDEGTSLRRLENLNCLYALTRDARLARHMTTEANVLFGPRYYGPPRHGVHNHGLMANVRLVQAGRLTGRSAWVAKAGARMRSEADLAFSANGTALEQSAKYHVINMDMWNDAAGELNRIDRSDPTVARIKATVAKAQVVSRWFTEPDGNLVQLGDTTVMPGLKPRGHERPGVFRDDEAGFLLGRWSWKDPSTTYYSLRYGPGRWAHGHNDKGSVTWTASGARILVDSGYYSFDWTDPLAVRARAPQAHNVSWPLTGRLSERAPATLRSVRATPGRHGWRVSDRMYGMTHTRHVTADHAARSFAVADVYPARQRFRQAFHLDPRWGYRGSRGKTQTYTDGEGRTLTMTTTGSFRALKRGSSNPPQGWTHPSMGAAQANWEIVLEGTGRMTTTFTVR